MKITFNNIEDLLSELDEVREESDPLVRYMTDVSEVSDDGFSVYFIAGFVIEGDVHCEAQVYCGKNINDRYLVGSDEAKKCEALLKDRCDSIGVRTRPGRYEVE